MGLETSGMSSGINCHSISMGLGEAGICSNGEVAESLVLGAATVWQNGELPLFTVVGLLTTVSRGAHTVSSCGDSGFSKPSGFL